MSRAICENNHVFTWRNKRGYRLADFPCPECGTKGRAVRDNRQANRLPIAQSPDSYTLEKPKRYMISHRATNQTYQASAFSADEACRKLGWLIGDCFVEELEGRG